MDNKIINFTPSLNTKTIFLHYRAQRKANLEEQYPRSEEKFLVEFRTQNGKEIVQNLSLPIEGSFFEIAATVTGNPLGLQTFDLREDSFRGRIAFVVADGFKPELSEITQGAIGINFVPGLCD